jgi:hypothetical protein
MTYLILYNLEEIYKWIDDNNIKCFYDFKYPFYNFDFDNINDAILFKLTWG